MNKAPEKFCPACGADITDSKALCDGGWYCDDCAAAVDAEDDGE